MDTLKSIAVFTGIVVVLIFLSFLATGFTRNLPEQGNHESMEDGRWIGA